MSASVIITQTFTKVNSIKFDWTASLEDGTLNEIYLTQTHMRNIIGAYANMAITIPKSPVPTNLYDIKILDENDFDIFGGTLLNRSNTLIEQTIPQILTDVLGPRQIVSNTFRFKLTNNSVLGAKGSCQIYFVR